VTLELNGVSERGDGVTGFRRLCGFVGVLGTKHYAVCTVLGSLGLELGILYLSWPIANDYIFCALVRFIWLRVRDLVTVWTVVQAVLTATFNSYGDSQISTPSKSIPLNQSTKNLAQLITSARGSCIPNLIQMHPLGASEQMGEI